MWKCNDCNEVMPLDMQKDHLNSCPKIFPYMVQCGNKTRYFQKEVEASTWRMQLIFVTDDDIIFTDRKNGIVKKY